ncbi:MAG: hypothetical protein AAF366_15630 [Pseudomonadota bacterium]
MPETGATSTSAYLDFSIFSETNRSLGPSAAVGFLGDYLSERTPSFGPALEKIELTVAHNGSISDHRGFPPLARQASVRFFAKDRRLRIVWIATWTSPDEAFGAYLINLTLEQWRKGILDLKDALDWAIGKRMHREPGFDDAAFLAWLHEQDFGGFTSDAELRKTLTAISDRRKTRLERQREEDPWSVVYVDWDCMHPEARTILDRPDDWSEGYEFSPHGNDTGAAIFADWAAYEGLSPAEAAGHLGWQPGDEATEFFRADWPKINLALAFGYIKIRGRCDPDLAASVRQILVDEIDQARERTSWPHRDEYVARMSRYVSILDRFAL